MGQVVVTFGAAIAKGEYGPVPVLGAYPRSTEEITTSGTHAVTSNAAGKDDVAVIKNNSDSAVWVAVGSAPVAAVGAAHFVLPNEAHAIGGLKEGHKLSVIDDS